MRLTLSTSCDWLFAFELWSACVTTSYLEVELCVCAYISHQIALYLCGCTCINSCSHTHICVYVVGFLVISLLCIGCDSMVFRSRSPPPPLSLSLALALRSSPSVALFSVRLENRTKRENGNQLIYNAGIKSTLYCLCYHSIFGYLAFHFGWQFTDSIILIHSLLILRTLNHTKRERGHARARAYTFTLALTRTPVTHICHDIFIHSLAFVRVSKCSGVCWPTVFGQT